MGKGRPSKIPLTDSPTSLAGLFKKGAARRLLSWAGEQQPGVDDARQLLRPTVSAISYSDWVADDGSEDRDGTDASAIEVATNASSNRQPAPQARPAQRDAHPHCVRSFFVLHNALPHCNMEGGLVGDIWAEQPIERP